METKKDLVLNAKSLVELLEALESIEDLDQERIDISALPVFGNKEPVSTIEIYSWDDDNYLTVDCNGSWEIVDREEFES